MATRTFDLVVIGTGSAAATVASQCRSAGWQVAVVDSRPFGGTCALRGCDPKKVLVGAAEVIDWTRRMAGKGIRTESLTLYWPDLMARFDPDLVDRLVEYTRSLGVDVQLQTEVKEVDRAADGLVVRASSSGKSRLFKASMAVHGAGRVPEIEDLGLEAAGVRYDLKRGAEVNEPRFRKG